MSTANIRSSSSTELRTNYHSKGTKEKSTRLKKADVIEDLFNNRNDVDEKSTRKQPTKLRISKAAQSLQNNLKEEIEKFLTKNRDIEKALQQIPLQEEEIAALPTVAAQNMRRFQCYASWLRIKEHHNDSKDIKTSDQDAAYLAMQKIGKDDQIKAIYERQTEQYSAAQQRQKEVALSHCYYYAVYPETYRFN